MTSWGKDEIDMLEQLKRVCVINMFVQSSSARIFDIVHNLLTVPNIVVGAVMSVSIFSTDCGPTRLAAGVMAIVSTVLSSLTKQVGAGERAQQHCFVVKEYHSLIRNIDVHLGVDKGDPKEREYFIRDVQYELDRLYMVQPEPSWLAIQIFEKKYKNFELAIFPEIERYAADIVGRTSHAPASKLDIEPTQHSYNKNSQALSRVNTMLRRPTFKRSPGFTTLNSTVDIQPSSWFSDKNNIPSLPTPTKPPTVPPSKQRKQDSPTKAATTNHHVSIKVENNNTTPSSQNASEIQPISSSPLSRRTSWALGSIVIGYGPSASVSASGTTTTMSTATSQSQQGGSSQESSERSSTHGIDTVNLPPPPILEEETININNISLKLPTSKLPDPQSKSSNRPRNVTPVKR